MTLDRITPLTPHTPATFTIGIDLGDRRHTACVLVAEETVPNTRECLERFSERFPGATMIMAHL